MAGQDYPCKYGDYVLLERLGVGGMSMVDLARKSQDEEFVRFLVIKRIKADRTDDEAFVRMFKDEARITSELHHNNIAQIYDFGRCGDEYYMALEYVPGVDVRHVINTLRQRRQRVPVHIALRVVYDVLKALEYAHSKVDQFGHKMNIVHRDVNPRNIMLSVRGETKLIDFGVAKATGRLERTKTDHVKGKFAYMAPEQVMSSDIDGRADLFAVGLTMHELFTGYGPFHGLSQVQIMHRLIAGRIPSLERPPAEFRDPDYLKKVHDKALASDPDQRYQTAAEYASDIENLAAPMGGLAKSDDLVRFLGHVDPSLAETVRVKMETFARPLDEGDLGDATTSAGVPVSGEFTGTMSGIGEPPTAGSATVTRTIIAAGSAAAGAALSLGIIALLALSGLVWWKWEVMFPAPGANVAGEQVVAEGDADLTGEQDPSEDPDADGSADGVSAEVEDAGTPLDGGTPHTEPATPAGPRSTPETNPIAVERTTDHTSPEPVVSEGTGNNTGAEPSRDSEESATEQPDDGSEGTGDAEGTGGGSETTAPDTTPPPPPPPVVTDFGTAQVASANKGLSILVDGVDSGEVTPAALRLSIGSHTIAVEGYAPQTIELRKNQRKPVIFK